MAKHPFSRPFEIDCDPCYAPDCPHTAQCIKVLQAETKLLKAIKIEAQKLVGEFDKIGRYQKQRLGHGLKEACQNWGEASDVGGMIDFAPLRQALQEKP